MIKIIQFILLLPIACLDALARILYTIVMFKTDLLKEDWLFDKMLGK